jgi:hypothetical protein
VAQSQATLTWRPLGNDPPFAGKVSLVSPDQIVLAIADFECYVQAVAEHRLVVWRSEERGEGPELERWLNFELYDADQLTPLDNVEARCAELGRAKRFCAHSGRLGSLVLTAAMTDGEHHLEIPEALQDLGVLHFLVHVTAESQLTSGFDQMRLCIWSLDTSSGLLTVVPQDWFNEGPYDFGYQWVTRVAQDPVTSQIVGEGIRLGLFRLDASARQVERWLHQYVFYHPDPRRGEA